MGHRYPVVNLDDVQPVADNKKTSWTVSHVGADWTGHGYAVVNPEDVQPVADMRDHAYMLNRRLCDDDIGQIPTWSSYYAIHLLPIKILTAPVSLDRL